MIVVTGNCGNYLFLFFHLINVLYDTKVLCTLIGIKFTLIYFVIFEGKNRKVNYIIIIVVSIMKIWNIRVFDYDMIWKKSEMTL